MAADDLLASQPEAKVHAFYMRLAQAAAERGKQASLETSLAADFLKVWLNPGAANRNPYVFKAPRHLRESSYVQAVLAYHRDVYLTRKNARLGGTVKSSKPAGIVPRLEDRRWNGVSPMSMNYESLVEVPITVQFLVYAGMGAAEDFDLLTSLRGFQLRSEVTVKGAPKSPRIIHVTFTSFQAQVIDTYDWNYNEYFTVANPDYQSKSPDAIAPQQQKVRVYHSNAKRLENKGLAKPFPLKSQPWPVTTAALTQPADVTIP